MTDIDIITVNSTLGGVGRTRLALAIAAAAQPLRPTVFVNRTEQHDALRYDSSVPIRQGLPETMEDGVLYVVDENVAAPGFTTEDPRLEDPQNRLDVFVVSSHFVTEASRLEGISESSRFIEGSPVVFNRVARRGDRERVDAVMKKMSCHSQRYIGGYIIEHSATDEDRLDRDMARVASSILSSAGFDVPVVDEQIPTLAELARNRVFRRSSRRV